jgi:hypothetical protein
MEQSNYGQYEPWVPVKGYTVDNAGYLYLPTDYPSNYRLRIRGIKFLDFLLSGVSSEEWTSSISLDQPQLDVLIGDAIVFLCTQMVSPVQSTGTIEQWGKNLAYWKQEAKERKNLYRMNFPPIAVHWG